MAAPLRAAAGPVCAVLASVGVIAAILSRPATAPGASRAAAAGTPTPGALGAASTSPFAAPPGNLQVEIPAGISSRHLLITLMRLGEVVQSSDGLLLDRVPAALLARTSVPGGIYVARATYRGNRVGDVTVVVGSGLPARVSPDRRRMAEIEYAAGLARARRGGRADVPYFRRAVELDSRHVGAHLQLAAAALAQGDTRVAAAHAGVVRKVEPFNPHAARLAELISKWNRKRR